MLSDRHQYQLFRPRDEMLISAIYAEIGIAFSNLPSLDILSQFPKKNDAGIFFEAIALQTKLAGIKAQKQLHYLQNLKKNTITEKITTLRENFEGNSTKIRKLEKFWTVNCAINYRI